MSDAVAKLRFDLLANLAGFTGPMADAGATSDKMAERFNRAFDSIKQSTERAKREMEAWQKAMQGEGSFLASSQTSFGASGNARELRLAEQLPFGKTFRTTLSKEAAETAAALGKETSNLKAKLDAAANSLVNRSGMAGGIGLMMDPAALAGKAFEFVTGKSEEMRERARQATHASQVLGTDVESASRLNAVGFTEEAGSHFQRSLFEGSEGFKNLGLDAKKLGAEPLSQALAEVGKALSNTKNPADRAAAAMDIFGKSGTQLLPVLNNLKAKLDDVSESAIVTAQQAERTKRYDAAARESSRAQQEAADRLARGMGGNEEGSSFQEYTGAYATFLSGGDTAKYWERVTNAKDRASRAQVAAPYAAMEQDKAARAAEWQARQKEAAATITALGLTSEGGMIAARNRDQYGNQTQDIIAGVRKQGAILGWGENQMGDEIARQKAHQREGQLANEAWGLAGNRTASEQYAENQRAIAKWRESVAPGRNDAGLELDRMNKTANRSYAAGLGIRNPEEEYADRMAELVKARGAFSAEKLQRAAADAADALMTAVDQPFMTSLEKYNAHMSAIATAEKGGAYTADQARRRREAETEQELSHAGIRRPLDDFKKSMEEIAGLRKGGTISQEEFEARERSLRRQAISGSLEDLEEVHATAAVGAGSREAYSAQVSAQLSDPRTQLAVETNKKLDALVKAAQKAADKAAPIVAEPAAAF